IRCLQEVSAPGLLGDRFRAAHRTGPPLCQISLRVLPRPAQYRQAGARTMNASQVSPLTRAQPTVPFNRSYVGTRELEYIREAIESRGLSGDGSFTRRCQKLLAERLACRSVLLTHSATAALEMAALLSDVQPGDEGIMPSFTFVSTANAYVLRGAVPVFIDIRPDTLNMDEKLLEPAITARTRAIVPVHYAGVACEMDEIMRVAVRHGVLVVEDAAQGINAAY